MAKLRAHVLRISLGSLLVLVLAFGAALLKNVRSEATSGVPAEQQAYWNWITLINRDSDAALKAGIDLLFRYPHLHLLYLRLPELCLEADVVEACREALSRVQPTNTHIALYRDAALIQLFEVEASGEARAGWQYIARSRALDPTLARLVVEEARQDREATWLPEVEATWKLRLAKDSTAIGAAFGLGYAANLRSDWDRAEPLLKHVTRVDPGDPEAYRELGRIYYTTGQREAFEKALGAGIKAAEARYDQEQSLILRGNLGLNLFQQGDLTKAAQVFEEVLTQSRVLADEETEGFNLYRLAGVRFKQFRYDEALALLDSAEVRYAEHAPYQQPEVQALRGSILRALYRFSDAERALGEAVEAARARRNVGVEIQAAVALTQLRYRMGRYAAARRIGLEALRLAQKYKHVDAEMAARMALGDVEHRWGSFEKARLHYQQGLDLATRSDNRARIAELHHRLGRTALSVGNTHDAQVHYSALLGYVQQHSDAARIARVYSGLGHVYSQFGNQDQAMDYYSRAVRQLQSAKDDRLHTSVLLNQAWLCIERGTYAEAESYLQKAERLIDRREDPSAAYRIEVARGNIYLNQDQYHQALRYFGRAAQLEAGLRSPSMQWHLSHATALAYWRLGRREEAETYFREAVFAIETMRENLSSRENRAAFIQNKISVYKNFAAFLEEQGRVAEAFSFTERARSRSLADLLHTTQRAGEYSTDDLRDQVIEAERRRRALAQAIARGASEPVEEEWEIDAADPVRASDLRREYERADSIYQANVSLLPKGRIYTAEPLVTDSVQVMLKPDEALIMYNLRDGSSDDVAGEGVASAAYVITRDTVYWSGIQVQAETLGETIRFFRDQIGVSGADPGVGWEQTSFRLYERLLEPVVAGLPASVRHLHIVPEGVLHYLPFAALRDARGRFLVERFTLSVAPSASVLKICREQNPILWRSILLVADPDRRLPGSRDEAEAIASIPRIRSLKLIGEQATQRNLEEFAEAHDIIHIATHGNFVSRAPWSSYLELYDSVLRVEEIDRLPLHQAYLVTLSACETGLSGGLISDVPAGDEWVGLNQAFLAAGTPTVMASLWPIDDEVSSRFMTGFYRNLLHARGKSWALAEIQRQFIHNPGTWHPFYWAAFTVIGDPL